MAESARPWWRRQVTDRLEAGALAAVWRVFGALGPDRASNLGGWLGRSFGPLTPIARRIDTNLRLALPEMDPAERRRIRSAVLENLGRTLAEYPHLAEITDPASRRVELIGGEWLDPPAGDPQPAIFWSGHLAHWEVMHLAGSRRRGGMVTVIREPNNARVRALLEQQRGVAGGRRVPKGIEGARTVYAALRDGEAIAVLLDQKLNEGEDLSFFGHPAPTGTAFALFALRYGCPFHPSRLERIGPARFRMTIEPPMDLTRFLDEAGGAAGREARDKAARNIMQAVNERLETWIRQRPADWLWPHRRWGKDVYRRAGLDI